MWDRITQAGRASWALLGVAATVALVMWLVWQVRVVLPPLVIAGAMVFVLNPVVSMLQRRGVPRAGGTALTYLALVGVVIGLGFLIAPLASDQADEFSEQWPELREDIENWVDEQAAKSRENNWIIEIPTVEELRDQLGGNGNTDVFIEDFDAVVGKASDSLAAGGDPVTAADLDRVAVEAKSRFPDDQGIGEQLATAFEIGTRIFEVGLIFILAPIIAFYMLVDLPHLAVVARQLVPSKAEPQVYLVAHRLNSAIGGYFRGQLAVAFIVGAMVSIGLAILDLPFWLIVGMIAGVFNMIPLIGPWVGAVPGVVIALATHDVGTALWVVAVMAGAQQIDNHFISPLVMQRTTSLHPAAVMMALLAGGSLGGFFGLLIAVPIAATLKVILGHLWRFYVLGQPLEVIRAIHDHHARQPEGLAAVGEPSEDADGDVPAGDVGPESSTETVPVTGAGGAS